MYSFTFSPSLPSPTSLPLFLSPLPLPPSPPPSPVGKEEAIPVPHSVEEDINQYSGHEAARRKAIEWLRIAKRQSSGFNLMRDPHDSRATIARSQQLVDEMNENIIKGVEVGTEGLGLGLVISIVCCQVV